MNTINKTSNLKFFLFAYLLITLIGLIFLYPSFNLAFGDDDWYTILLYKTGTGLGLFTPYGIQWWLFGTLYDLIGPTYYIYFIIAFFLRSLAAFSVLLFIFTLTKNRILAILGGFMIFIGFSGIQTTFEPVNMNVYVSVIGYMIFLIFFYLSRDNLSIRNLILMGTFLLFATFISPVRSYPLYIWALIVDALWLLKSFTKEKVKRFLIRQFIIIFIFLALILMGTLKWRVLEDTSAQSSYLARVGNDLSRNIDALIHFDLTRVFNFLTGVGNVILPGKENLPPTFNTVIGSIFTFVSIVTFFLFFKKSKKDNLPFLDFLLWVLIFYSGYLIITLDPHNAFAPLLIFSPMRYLFPVYTGFVISLVFLAQYFTVKKSASLKWIILGVAGLLIIIHSVNLNTYLKNLSNTRDGSYNKKVWEEMKNHVPNLDFSSGKPSIFYFETDNSSRAFYALSGSSRQYLIIYEIPQLPQPQTTPYNPIAFYTFEGLIQALTGKLQGVDTKINPSEPPPWERIYAFRLEGDKLINIKDNIKERVEKALNNANMY